MILGLDLSLTSTGWAAIHIDGAIETGVIAPEGELTDRLVALSFDLTTLLTSYSLTFELVVIEDLPRNARFGGVALGMVHAVCRLALHDTDRPGRSVWYVAPATLKVIATGKGGAGKDEVLAAAIRRLGYAGHSHDEADALWLADLGARRLGWDRPELPATHLRALTPGRKTTKKAAR